MTYNTMPKIKKTKEQTMIYRVIHRTLKTEPKEPHKNTGLGWRAKCRCSERLNSSWGAVLLPLLQTPWWVMHEQRIALWLQQFLNLIFIKKIISLRLHFESGRFGALKSDSTHHFFRNACTKSGSLRFSQFSGCWLILSMCDVKVFLTFASPNMVLLWQLFYLFCSCI